MFLKKLFRVKPKSEPLVQFSISLYYNTLQTFRGMKNHTYMLMAR